MIMSKNLKERRITGVETKIDSFRLSNFIPNLFINSLISVSDAG